MAVVRLLLAYDGSDFAGWQVQSHDRTVQGVVEDALAKPLRGRHPIIGASRTDAGVHALGQVAHFHADRATDLHKLWWSLNGLLPAAVRCMGIHFAEDNFHSQLCAKRKSYVYRIDRSRSLNPMRRLDTTHWPFSFCPSSFRAAADCFVGTHDFSALANENHRGQAARGAVRTIESILIHEEGPIVEIRFIGNGFLYKQVRNMMGCMLAAAEGKTCPEQIREWMLQKDRKLVPPPAPAQGLCLEWIDYGAPLTWYDGRSFCS